MSSKKDVEKLSIVDAGLGGVTLKRRMFFLVVYHVVPDEMYTILKVTQESTTKDVMIQALHKAGKPPSQVSWILNSLVSIGKKFKKC